MPTAAILGLDTAAGAYLARMLGARGYAVTGTGGGALLDRLGIADDVRHFDDTAGATAGAVEVYDLRGDPAATTALFAEGGTAKVFVAADPSDTVVIAALDAARTDRFVATGRVYPHESRLGPGTTPVARIVASAEAGRDPDALDMATATDCGWTAEYVDAMWRMLQRPRPEDLAIATGRLIGGSEAARIAAAYFGRAAPPVVPMPAAAPVNPAPAHAALGWRAVTWGDDLVTVLCEGAAA